ncbi:hypothetical protein FG386_000997 [Cryptosporidium ryanae]|uniref:uncharacterized protein n=1 Tax=Cryptosporidium ryanae TaxID=515981 RepID=UPI00351A38EB|nr:hypothetical protein FG386_000997 [Cryptosporidium ryanae]
MDSEVYKQENEYSDQLNSWNVIKKTNSEECSEKLRGCNSEVSENNESKNNGNKLTYEFLFDKLSSSQALGVFKKLRNECIGLLDPPIVLEQQFLLDNGERVSTRGK